jgi:hypothetical protein
VVLTRLAGANFPHQNGTPALKVHENIVSVPLGQALSVGAMGPVSVVANHFASLGIVRQKSGLAIGTVQIMNLGLPIELVGELLTYQAIREGDLGKSDHATGAAASTTDVTVTSGSRAAKATGRFLPDGSILFTNNHCLLDLLETAGNRFITSIAILTLDDLGFHNNQCMANLLRGFVFAQAYLFALSNRVTDNRFEEPLLNAIYSAVSLGIANITSHNEATHCLLIAGLPSLLVKDGNTVLVDALKPGTCRHPSSFLANFAARRV